MHIGNNDKVRLEWDFDTFMTMCIIDVSFFLVIIRLNLLCPGCGTAAITYYSELSLESIVTSQSFSVLMEDQNQIVMANFRIV
jgi:hypothetical protein